MSTSEMTISALMLAMIAAAASARANAVDLVASEPLATSVSANAQPSGGQSLANTEVK